MYRCECVEGFTAPHCELNINDCIGVNCFNGGECRDEVTASKRERGRWKGLTMDSTYNI